MPVPREIFKGHDPRKPLSYAQLHSQALDFMSGYIDVYGNIRDEWFEAKFKGDGWVQFKERYKYEHILDGNIINNETEYWNYIWKKKGQMLWRRKAYQDSITSLER
jgi:hypothetical protein